MVDLLWSILSKKFEKAFLKSKNNLKSEVIPLKFETNRLILFMRAPNYIRNKFSRYHT